MQQYFFVKNNRDNKRFIKVKMSEILYLKACTNYVRIVTKKEAYLTYAIFGKVEDALKSNKEFCRVHRSYIVSLDYVDSFDRDWVYIGEETIPIGTNYRSTLRKQAVVLERESGLRHFLKRSFEMELTGEKN